MGRSLLRIGLALFFSQFSQLAGEEPQDKLKPGGLELPKAPVETIESVCGPSCRQFPIRQIAPQDFNGHAKSSRAFPDKFHLRVL